MIEIIHHAKNGKVFYARLPFAPTDVFGAIMQTSWLDLPEFDYLKQWLMQTPKTADINPKCWYVGIFSQKVRLCDGVADGARIEIYRPLPLSPMQKRKQKA